MKARKRFGQHFLTDQGILNRIASTCQISESDTVFEIGPGHGALTEHLIAAHAHRYVAVEIDRDLTPLLAARFPALELINKDILRVDLDELAETFGNDLRVVGNLPYNISTPLIFHLLDHLAVISDMVFMVQKEVANRLVAGPGDKLYGRLSVMAGASLDCQYLFDVAPQAFDPPPAVDSAVIRMQPALRPAKVSDRALFSALVRTAFSQRRKTLRNSLKGLASKETFDACGLDSALRAEALSVDDFAKLTNFISD